MNHPDTLAALAVTTTDTVYLFIRQYLNEQDYPPTVREIAAGCYLAPSTVARHLDRLEAWGWISREPGRARGLKVVEPVREKAVQKSEQMFATRPK